MNVTAVVAPIYPHMGGAQITVLTCLEKLHAEYGYTCQLLTPFPRKHTRTQNGVVLSTYRDTDELKSIIKARRPDVLLAALEPTPQVLGVASRFGIPTITYFQSYEFCQPSPAEKRLWGLDPEREYPSRHAVAYTLRGSDALLANSAHLQKCFVDRYNCTPRVLYPEFDLKPLVRKRVPQYITGICGSLYKGIEIWLALADAFPNEKFLLVGAVQPEWEERVRQRANITVRGHQERNKFLCDSKIVLVPSQWPEPFGRIAVEALSCGIPILASYTGGLKEIVGSSPMGIKHFRSPEAWRVRLAALLASEQLQFKYGELGQALVSKFLRGDSTKELNQVIRGLAANHVPNYAVSPLIQFRGGVSSSALLESVTAARQRGLLQMLQVVEGQADMEFQVPDIVIDAEVEPTISERNPPPAGKWVVVQTEEAESFPAQWVEKVNAECDQLWVRSHRARKEAIAFGMDSRRVLVVPSDADQLMQHLAALERYETPYRLRQTRRNSAHRLKQLEIARRLFAGHANRVGEASRAGK